MAMANKGQTRAYKKGVEINLSDLGTNLSDSYASKDEHAHTYDDIVTAHPTNSSGAKPARDYGHQTNKSMTTTSTSDDTVTRRMIALNVIGSILLATLISVITITVYHVTIARMAENDKQDQYKASTTSSDPVDTFTLKLGLLENNLTGLTDEVASLKRQYRRDCNDLYAAGTVEDGVYTISPDGRCPFHVYCDMTGGGWTLIQTRIDGSVNFRRTWKEYAHGFGNIDGEHWLGLDKIHRLTADGSQIYFHLEYYDGKIGFAHYQSFSVHGPSTDYQMSVATFGYNGTINEIFSYHNNMKFSTYDLDNDANSGNCANDLGGSGWWYNSCHKLGNLNGVYGKQALGGIYYVDRSYIYLQTVSIKVKPVPGQC